MFRCVSYSSRHLNVYLLNKLKHLLVTAWSAECFYFSSDWSSECWLRGWAWPVYWRHMWWVIPASFKVNKESICRLMALNRSVFTIDSSYTSTFVISAILDIPVHKSRVQSLHVLFTLYSEFKNSQVRLPSSVAVITLNQLEHRLRGRGFESCSEHLPFSQIFSNDFPNATSFHSSFQSFSTSLV